MFSVGKLKLFKLLIEHSFPLQSTINSLRYFVFGNIPFICNKIPFKVLSMTDRNPFRQAVKCYFFWCYVTCFWWVYVSTCCFLYVCMSSGKHPCAGLAFWCHPFLFWKNKIINKYIKKQRPYFCKSSVARAQWAQISQNSWHMTWRDDNWTKGSGGTKWRLADTKRQHFLPSGDSYDLTKFTKGFPPWRIAAHDEHDVQIHKVWKFRPSREIQLQKPLNKFLACSFAHKTMST